MSLFVTDPPSDIPSMVPNSNIFERYPSLLPSIRLNDDSSGSNNNDFGGTTFYAIGDVPYNRREAENLTYQMQNLPGTADFVIHVGDFRDGSSDNYCSQDDFARAANILRLSPVPVFVVLGDNDWPDCSNTNEGLQYWRDEFQNFESRYWDHDFDIVRHPDIPENFAFTHKGTLFVGLNLVGSSVMYDDEWSDWLSSQADWVLELIRDYRQSSLPRMGQVALFCHADPSEYHADFFRPLRTFIRDELDDSMPILYLNGHQHAWSYDEEFYDQSSFLRIMVTGGASEPPLKITVNADDSLVLPEVDETFVYDRDLDNAEQWNSAPERN